MPTASEALAIALKHHQAGELQAAEQIYRKILVIDPNHADAIHLLGVIAFQSGQHELAIERIRRAIELNATESAFHINLGNAFQAQGKLDDAIECFRRAAELKPQNPKPHFLLGNVFLDQRKLDDAVGSYRRAIERNPGHAEAHYNLGIAFQDQGKFDESVNSYRSAMKVNPSLSEVHYNLGTAFHEQGKLDDAAASFQRALALNPDDAESQTNLGAVFLAQRKLDEAVASYRRALEIRPDDAEAASNLLLALQYRPGVTLSELAAAHADYEQQHTAPLRATWHPHENDRNPNRPLRLGFVSPNFGQHPVGCFLIRVLENLDRAHCETVCYHDRTLTDRVTSRFQSAATIWRDVHGWSDEQLADQIRADRIDALFDLAGHTAKNRLRVFARKPAPIQITWAGYAGTTGLTAINYILADRFQIPPDAEAHYRERVLRMPDGYVCYDPPSYAPAVAPLPAVKNSFVTFGSFNNPPKITSHVVAVWARILNRVPRSRMVLKHKGMSDPSVANPLANEFASHGIDPRRIEFLGWSPHVELLAEYHCIDIALDPFPYSGGLTTCEALWMGVPVIICPGQTFASRHSFSHLSVIGFTETIARDFDEYENVAVSLATDLPGLTTLRANLRDRVAASPLCDGKRFAENLTRLLRELVPLPSNCQSSPHPR